MQKKDKYKKVKEIKNKESRIVRDLNNKVSRKIVDTANSVKAGIKMEVLKGIRKTKKQARSFRYSLNSWSFHQLQKMIEYKTKLLGVSIIYINPAYTSQERSRCGMIGKKGKRFECLQENCRHVDYADVNAVNENLRFLRTLARRVCQ